MEADNCSITAETSHELPLALPTLEITPSNEVLSLLELFAISPITPCSTPINLLTPATSCPISSFVSTGIRTERSALLPSSFVIISWSLFIALAVGLVIVIIHENNEIMLNAHDTIIIITLRRIEALNVATCSLLEFSMLCCLKSSRFEILPSAIFTYSASSLFAISIAVPISDLQYSAAVAYISSSLI